MPASPPGAGRTHGVGNRDYVVTWGAQDTLFLDANPAGASSKDSQQLVYIANELPETFSLSLFAQVLEGTFSGAGQIVQAHFKISYGVGSARIVVPFIISFDTTLAAPVQNYLQLKTPFAVGYVGGAVPFEFPVQQLNVEATLEVAETTVKTTMKIAATSAPRFKMREPEYEWTGHSETRRIR